MKQRLAIQVTGKREKWFFIFEGDPKHIPEWEADGLAVFELANTVPAWVVRLGFMRPYIFLQAVFGVVRL